MPSIFSLFAQRLTADRPESLNPKPSGELPEP